MDRKLIVGIGLDGGPRDAAGLAAVGRRAESAGFGFLTPAESGLDPVTAAAFLSAHTAALGLVPVVSTAHAEPFHVSNQLSSLDLGSRGRAGWLLGANRDTTEAADVVDAARRLWDSWQDDAIIADEGSGRFLDADRVHHVDFRGRTFGIRGPALLPRPPQGQVLVFAPTGALPVGLVDVEVVSGPDEGAVRAAAAAASAPRVVAEVEIGAGHARSGTDRLRHTGSATELGGLLRRLAEVVDGVRLVPRSLDRDLATVADLLPTLPVRRPEPGRTLRDLFALPRPAGRHTS